MALWVVALPLVVAVGLFMVGYGIRDFRRRWRRIVAGVSLIGLVAPVWLFNSGGQMGRSSAVLVLAPPASLEDSQTFSALLPGQTPVSFATISATTPPDQIARKFGWAKASDIVDEGANTTLSLTEGWAEDAAKGAIMPWYRRFTLPIMPKPNVVMLDNGGNILDGIDPSRIDVTSSSAIFNSLGVTFHRIKTTGTGMGGGRLQLSTGGGVVPIRNSATLPISTLPTRVSLTLVGCPYPSQGDYKIRAWIDHSGVNGQPPIAVYDNKPPRAEGADARTDVVVGASPEAPRLTYLSLHEFDTTVVGAGLDTGWHEVSVELSFAGKVGEKEVPLSYRSSLFIEVADRKMVVFSKPSNAEDLMRHSWVHRVMGGSFTHPPNTAGSLVKDLVENRLISTGNHLRVGNSSVEVVTDPLDVTTSRLASAAGLVLVEPDWDDLSKMDDAVEEFVGRGGSVLTVCSPERPSSSGLSTPSWLAAEADPDRPLVRADRRIYIVIDAGRPGSLIGADDEAGTTGAQQQIAVVNKLAKKLSLRQRAVPGSIDSVVGLQAREITVLGTSAGVLQAEARGGWSLIPPLMARGNASNSVVVQDYINNIGAYKDIVSSGIELRLGLLTSDQRSGLYSTSALKQIYQDPSGPLGIAPQDIDLPLVRDVSYPNTLIIVFSADVPQPKTPKPADLDIWTFQGQASTAAPIPLKLSELTEAGARVAIVPLTISPSYFGANGPYGSHLQDAMRSDPSLGMYEPIGSSYLQGLASAGGATLTSPLSLSASDTNQDKVVDEIVALLDSIVGRQGEVSVKEPGRAVDLRVDPGFPVNFAYRPLKPTSRAKGFSAAAVVEAPTMASSTEIHPIIYTVPFGKGLSTCIGYSPTNYHSWDADIDTSLGRGPFGWGIQRLVDPFALLPVRLQSGKQLEKLEIAADRSHLKITCRLPISNTSTGVGGVAFPTLVSPAGATVPELAVLAFDPISGRAEVSASAPSSEPISGRFKLKFFPSDSGTDVFIALEGRGDPTGEIRSRLDRIALQTGGAVSSPLGFIDELDNARLDLRWLGSGVMMALTALLLSPLARAWYSPVGWIKNLFSHFLADRTSSERRGDADDEAEAVAAFETGGMSEGAATAQRPAGRVLQLRGMRSGDSAAAVPPNKWLLFLPEITRMIGSPPLPDVIETPKPQAMSVLTLLDLHSGIDAHDSGLAADRMRVLKRIAMLNCLASNRRGGIHRVTSLQSREPVESTTANSPSRVADRIAELRSSIGKQIEIPEISENELVVLVCDPASITDDEEFRRIARACGEKQCRLTAVVLSHPSQLSELGNVTYGSLGLFDRSDLDRGVISGFHTDRAEQIGAALSAIDSRTATASCEQPTQEIVKILAEDAWSRN